MASANLGPQRRPQRSERAFGKAGDWAPFLGRTRVRRARVTEQKGVGYCGVNSFFTEASPV